MTTTQNSESQASMTPDRALELLIEGNRRFTEDQRENRNLLQQVAATTGGQWPYAAVLSCIDSRVSAELVFDVGIGDIFSARIAGNVANEDLLGSLEFACKLAGSKLVVVLGHTHCGAVKGACDGAKMGNLTTLLSKLQPAVDAISEPSDAGQRNSGNKAFVQAVATKNIQLTVQAIRDRSDVLREMEEDGDIKIVGAMYDIETGAVEFSS